MKIFTTSKARILFVSVPEDAKAFHIGDFTGNLNYFRGLLIRPCSIELPDGQWQFLFLLNDMTESQASTVLNESNWYMGMYTNFMKSESSHRSDQCRTALESLHSLANHLGCEGNQVILVEKFNDMEDLNIHQRRELEKNKTHTCKNCGAEVVGWSSDNIPNCYLSCHCNKCDNWNAYWYWP